MSKILGFYKKVRRDSRLSTLTVSILGACLFAVIILFVCMPGLQAAEAVREDAVWTPNVNEYVLSDLQSGDSGKYIATTINLNENNVYTIKGDSSIKENIQITLNYNGISGTKDNPAVVNVILEDVYINQLSDISAIALSTTTNAVKFNLTIKGNCTIKSVYENATKPLIAVESVSYDLLELHDGMGDDPSGYVSTVKVGNEVSLVLKGDNSESQLTLVNAQGSMGALIGSSEINATVGQTNQMMSAIEEYYNSRPMGSEIYISNVGLTSRLINMGFTLKSGETNVFEPQFRCKNASGFTTGNITIGGEIGSESSLRLNLSNSGYGASVGSGGSKDVTKSACDAKSIIINAGTITVFNNRTDCNSPIFGSGIAKGATNVENTYGNITDVQINGGSIFFGASSNKFGGKTGLALPTNALRQKLYEVEANTHSETKCIINMSGLSNGDTLPIQYRYDSSLNFSRNLEDITSSSINGAGAVNILDVVLNLSDTQKYKYSGTGHRNGDSQKSCSLYFYLPAIQTTTLTITDEFGPGQVNFTLKEQGSSTPEEPISSDTTSADNRRYVIERNKIYYLTADNIPDGLTITGVKLTKDNNVTDASSSAGRYVIIADNATIKAEVSYGGKIPIIYDGGLVAGDEGKHDITMPVSEFEYGTSSFRIPEPVVNTQNDLIFAGWVYTKADGTEVSYLTHIISGTDVDPYKISYSNVVQSGKIYLKAKWKVSVKYDIGENATLPGGDIEDTIVDYGSGTNNVMNVTLTNKVPQKELFAFSGWSLDDGAELFNYTQGGTNTIQMSTLTSHVFKANYDRNGFGVFIDASTLNQSYADLVCTDNAGNSMLVMNGSELATIVKDGKTYYYTSIVRKDAVIRVVIKTKTGYKISNCSVTVTGASSNSVSSDGNAQCNADITVGEEDVYVSTDAAFSPIEYSVSFKDGKVPNEYLWRAYRFTYTIEDITSGKTIGDIIRKGFGKTLAEMSDNDIALSVNAIDKNNRFTDFSGWSLPLSNNVMQMNKTLASIFAENNSMQYGDFELNACWTEYDKFAIDVTLLERLYSDGGFFRDVQTDKLTAVLYYFAEGSSTRVPVYTEDVRDPDTGERKTVAYAKAGDRIVVSLYRTDSYGNPTGEPVVNGISVEALYYEYKSKINENVHVDVTDSSNEFTIKSDVKDDTLIKVYMVFTAKEYNIIYWDLRGHENSFNPRKYTIFDSFDFVPIETGVDWLLVCQDTDNSNDDDVTTEIITGIRQDGKLLTDGPSANRDYASNLILKPDWGDDKTKNYNITIDVDETEFGRITVIYPTNPDGFFENDTIILSVVPKEGYKLVENSLIYTKKAVQTYSLLRRATTYANPFERADSTYTILPVDEANGTYIFTMPNSDVVINALFELCQYDITYNEMPSDVENNNPDTYNLYSDILLNDLEREGYKFLGWFDNDGNRIVKISGRTGNLVLRPEFELLEEPENPDDGENEEPTSPDDGGNEEPTSPDDSEEPTTSGDGEEPTTSNNGNSQDGNNSGGNNNAADNDKPNNVTISGRPSNVVQRPGGSITQGNTNNNSNNNNSSAISGSAQTGDKTNVPRLILICVGAVLVLMIIVIKRPGKDKEE